MDSTFAEDALSSSAPDSYNGTMSYYYKEPPWLQAIFIVVYGLVSIMGISGNAIVCYIVLSEPRMRTVTNYFIVNLAVSDLLMAVVCVNLTFYYTLFMHWPFGPFLCKVVAYVQNVSVSVSIFTLVAVGFDRYVAIMHPLTPRMTVRQTITIVVIIWSVACMFALPTAFSTMEHIEDGITYCTEGLWEGTMKYSLVCLMVQYVIPLKCLLVVYSIIGRRIWGRQTPGEGEKERDKRLNDSKRKLVKLFATVVLTFALCYLPIHLFNLIQDFNEELLEYEYFKIIYMVVLLIALSNCFVNPIIYCWMNAKFRNGFRRVFRFLPCVSSKHHWKGGRFVSGKDTAPTQMESVSMSYKSERPKSSSETNYPYIALQIANNNHMPEGGNTNIM